MNTPHDFLMVTGRWENMASPYGPSGRYFFVFLSSEPQLSVFGDARLARRGVIPPRARTPGAPASRTADVGERVKKVNTKRGRRDPHYASVSRGTWSVRYVNSSMARVQSVGSRSHRDGALGQFVAVAARPSGSRLQRRSSQERDPSCGATRRHFPGQAAGSNARSPLTALCGVQGSRHCDRPRSCEPSACSCSGRCRRALRLVARATWFYSPSASACLASAASAADASFRWRSLRRSSPSNCCKSLLRFPTCA